MRIWDRLRLRCRRVLQSPFLDDLPDDCLSYVFGFLGSMDRKSCSLVSRRWLRVEGGSRHHLFLNAPEDKPKSRLPTIIPALFARFPAVTTIALESCEMGDNALALISIHCPYLTSLKLDACVGLTDASMAAVALNCRVLKELSCHSCNFGTVKGMNAIVVVDQYCSLEVLSIKSVVNGCQCFGQLIIAAASKNLRTLKISRCHGDWDKVFEEAMKSKSSSLVEIYLVSLPGVSDATLVAISKACLDLKILCLIETASSHNCTDAGLVSVANHCKFLRELYILRLNVPFLRSYTLGSEKGLSAIAKGCLNLRVLVLYGCDPTSLNLGLLAANCQKLERLALCHSIIGDAEISRITTAAKCTALRRFGIMGCIKFSDQGIKVLSGGGCPNLVELVIYGCLRVTAEGINQLKADRTSLSVSTLPVKSGTFWDILRDQFKIDCRKLW